MTDKTVLTFFIILFALATVGGFFFVAMIRSRKLPASSIPYLSLIICILAGIMAIPLFSLSLGQAIFGVAFFIAVGLTPFFYHQAIMRRITSWLIKSRK